MDEVSIGYVAATAEGIDWLLHEADDVERMRWGYENLQGTQATAEQRFRDLGIDYELAARFAKLASEYYALAREKMPSLLINASIRSALAAPEFALPEVEIGYGKMPSSPRFTTGIGALDSLLDGGLYGVAAISGAPKVGKSLFAMMVAYEAARSGWRVMYYNAEMTRSTLTNRMLALCGGYFSPEVSEALTFRNIERGMQVNALAGAVIADLNFDTERCLVVLDSINTAAEMSCVDYRSNYFDALRNIGHLAMASRKISEGLCSWLLVSEQNARGEIKGLKLQYTADVVLKLDASDAEGQVELEVQFSRESRSGKLGRYYRSVRDGRFVGVAE